MKSPWMALRASTVISLVALAAGCTALPSPAVRQIEEADRAYRAGRYEHAAQLLSPVIDAHADKPDTAEALYLRGLCRLKTSQPARARADLDKALYLARRNDLVNRVHTQLANLEFERKQYERAAVLYEPAYDDLPDRPPKDRVGYQYGVALQRVGRFGEARAVLADAAAKFPRSAYAARARRKASWSHDHFAIQCGVFRGIAASHRHARSLKAQGIDAVAVPENTGAARRYAVRLGRYHTYAAARRDLPRVRRVQSDAFIVP